MEVDLGPRLSALPNSSAVASSKVWPSRALVVHDPKMIVCDEPTSNLDHETVLRSRALYAISAAVIARGDDGRWKPNYSRLLGNFY